MSYVKYTKEILEDAVKKCLTFSELGRFFNLAPHGGANSHLKSRVLYYGISTSHFDPHHWRKGRISPTRKPAYERLVFNEHLTYRMHGAILKKALISIGRDEECAIFDILPTNEFGGF